MQAQSSHISVFLIKAKNLDFFVKSPLPPTTFSFYMILSDLDSFKHCAGPSAYVPEAIIGLYFMISILSLGSHRSRSYDKDAAQAALAGM